MVTTEELLSFPFELKHGPKEAKMVLDQLNKNINVIMSSSSGRVLDAAAALLGICKHRTYQGEPSMKLESTAKAVKGTSLELHPLIKDNIFDTSSLLYELYELKNDHSAADLAYAYEDAFAKGIAQLAIRAAKKNRVDIIGLTGGVAYNEHIACRIKDEVKEAGFEFISHNRVPCGDAGVSLGQALVASMKKEEEKEK